MRRTRFGIEKARSSVETKLSTNLETIEIFNKHNARQLRRSGSNALKILSNSIVQNKELSRKSGNVNGLLITVLEPSDNEQKLMISK